MYGNKRIIGFFSALGLLILILDGKTALTGASAGIELCLKTVIPALFPFFVLSNAILENAHSGGPLTTKVCSLCKLPTGMEALLLPGFLGGYPVGAQCVHRLYESNHLTKKDAERLLAFCNNVGPSFLFGIVGQMFPKRWMVWTLWCIHIIGALTAAQCVKIMGSSVGPSKQILKPSESLMSKSVYTMGIVCGWIILFRVFIAFLDRWLLWLLPQTMRIALIGVIELSNGCCELSGIADIPIRFILCSGMLAAGGLCVTMQTISVTHGLSKEFYWYGKMIQILVSVILSASFIYRSGLLLVLLLPILYWTSKKRDGNQITSGV